MRQPLGQHFLRDPSVVQAILAAAELTPTDVALEIGPGKAVLTEPLAARVSRLVAIELDRDLATMLQKRFEKQRKITVVRADFLKISLDQLPWSIDSPPVAAGNDEGRAGSAQSSSPAATGGGAIVVKVLGNLPYSITAPIFEKLLAWPGWNLGVFLIQREVADRLRATHGSRTYGLLSLAVQLFADVEAIKSVPPGAFAPPPEVHSSVVRLRRKAMPLLPAEDVPAFFDFARAAFGHRRKTVSNSVVLATGIPKKTITEWLQSQQLNPDARAEQIALSDYARISHPWAIFRREMGLTL